MEQRLSIITLGAQDIVKARKFYGEGLGWQEAASSNEHIVFFQLNGMVLALYPLDNLAEDTGLKLALEPDKKGFRGVTLAYNVRDKKAVESTLAEAKKAGGKIVKVAQDVFWGGYHGYFSDPDGHLWEVAWNPFVSLNNDGTLVVS